jgi:phosphatidylserine synthase
LVLVPALLMVSTIRFRSVKAMEVGWRRSYLAIFLAAVALSLIAVYPRVALVAMSYTYVLAGLVFWIVGRIHRRHHEPSVAAPVPDTD